MMKVAEKADTTVDLKAVLMAVTMADLTVV